MATAVVDSPQSVPSHLRCVPGSVNVPVAAFPAAATKESTPPNPSSIATDLVAIFNKILETGDYDGLSKLFVDEGYWRDHLALSWSFRTSKSPSQVHDFLKSCSKSKDGFRLQRLEIDDSTPFRKPQIASIDPKGTVSGVQFFTKLTTARGAGVGIFRLVEENGQWKIFTLFTRLEELRGHEELIYSRRPKGVEHGGQAGRKNWAERRADQSSFNKEEPAVLVVGAGQGGLTAAARLKMLGVEALLIDQNERIGDNWYKRYHQLVLHDPVWYDHMPYLTFPPNWPIFTPKDKLGQFFEAYAALLELNVWTRTTIVYTRWDDKKKHWDVVVHREHADGSTESRVLHPRHIIQATGHSGKKSQPDFKGVETFQGYRLCHSSEFPGADDVAAGEEKKAVVVGSCNSAHDIAQDYLEKGYHVTIVQRSTTHVVSSSAITDIALNPLYSEHGPHVDDADLLFHSLPTPVLKGIQIAVVAKQKEHDREMLEGLEKAGFKVDHGPDEAGLLFKYFQRGGGYYINVGASQLVAEGKIKVKQGQEIDRVLPNGLRFADGSELEADEIVFATGYQNMRTQTRVVFGDEVADKVGDVWGFNEEGEMKVMWQSSGHPGFWFHGGNLAISRYYSKMLALQIKAQEAGLYREGEI